MPEWTLTAIAICQIVITATIFLAAAALVIGFFMIRSMINKKVNEAMSKVQPIINQAKAISEQARDTVDEASAKANSIMRDVESTSHEITNKIDAMTTRLESTAENLSGTLESLAGQINTSVGAIMQKAESTVDQVSGSVSGVTKKVEDAVSPPINTAASLIGTATRAYELYCDIARRRQERQGNGQEPTKSEETD